MRDVLTRREEHMCGMAACGGRRCACARACSVPIVLLAHKASERCVYTHSHFLVYLYERARRGGGGARAARRTVSELGYLYVFRMNTP